MSSVVATIAAAGLPEFGRDELAELGRRGYAPSNPRPSPGETGGHTAALSGRLTQVKLRVAPDELYPGRLGAVASLTGFVEHARAPDVTAAPDAAGLAGAACA